MATRLVKDGTDPLTKPILDYLDRRYGFPHDHIKAVYLMSEVGQAQIIQVDLLVQVDDPPQTIQVDGGDAPTGTIQVDGGDVPTETIQVDGGDAPGSRWKW